ncbi:MAG: CDP-alcohol phosphatidyltransferase family protein [Anaerolineales bacterium]
MRTRLETLSHEELLNWPNAITLGRVLIGLTVFGFAAYSQSTLWNFVGLVLHWALDGLDGYLARSMKQETRFGAQIDIIADRVLLSFFYINYLQSHPYLAVPIAWYLIMYGFVDHYLSNQFIRWGLLSPNYFYQADSRIWLLNWSTPGKFVNSGLFTVLVLGTNAPVAPIAGLIGLTFLKLYTFMKIHMLPLPQAWAMTRSDPPEVRLSVSELLMAEARGES